MELKYNNLQSEIVLANILNLVEFFLNYKNRVQNKSNILFVQEISMIAHKIRSSINFPLLVHME